MSSAEVKSLDNSKNKTDQNKKHGPLPFLEISLYWVLWISLSSYSLYSSFRASQGKMVSIHTRSSLHGLSLFLRNSVTSTAMCRFYDFLEK